MVSFYFFPPFIQEIIKLPTIKWKRYNFHFVVRCVGCAWLCSVWVLLLHSVLLAFMFTLCCANEKFKRTKTRQTIIESTKYTQSDQTERHLIHIKCSCIHLYFQPSEHVHKIYRYDLNNMTLDRNLAENCFHNKLILDALTINHPIPTIHPI